MSNTDSTSNKLDVVLAKMDHLLRSRDLQEVKFNSILEFSIHSILEFSILEFRIYLV